MDAKEANTYIAIIIGVILIGIIILFFAISIIRQQRRNMELQRAAIYLEISAMEKERSRIAADLHDDLGPLLSVIQFQVDHVESVDPEEKELLNKASGQLDGLIGRLREVANNLMPSALQRKGLVAAIREFVNKTEGTANLKIEFTCYDTVTLSEDKGINVYRAIQEVVHNCIKHADAKLLEIKVEQSNGMLSILCKDDGWGFDYTKQSKESSGMGLRSLKNRTEIVGGNLTIESKIGKGTAHLFEIPI